MRLRRHAYAWGSAVTSVLAALVGARAVLAAPPVQGMGGSVVVAPGQAMPGEAVRVSVAGIGGLPAGGATFCIGFLGPGQNPELGLSPSFRSRLGTVVVNTAGTGQAEVRLPVQAAAGSYRITVGGCPPQADLAPLAWVAEGQLSVTRGGATGLPATGGGVPLVPAAGAALLAAGAGVIAARRRR